MTRTKDKPNTGADMEIQEICASSVPARCHSPTLTQHGGDSPGAWRNAKGELSIPFSTVLPWPRRQKVCHLGLLGAPSEPVALPSLLTEGHTASCLGAFSSQKYPGGPHTVWANSPGHITMLGWAGSPKAWSQGGKQWETQWSVNSIIQQSKNWSLTPASCVT